MTQFLSQSQTPEYVSWKAMKYRCTNENDINWHRYGARGITVCEEWLESFDAFLRDMGPRPSPDHSIERIKNDRGYEPGNCRWATVVEQANNRRSNVFYEMSGQSKTLAQWAREFKCAYKVLHNRVRDQGIDLRTALEMGVRRREAIALLQRYAR